MKTRNAEAQRLEAEYLAQLRSALGGRESSDAAEIHQGVVDHIDEALEELAGEEVTAVQMANVLERLGPPESFALENGVPVPGQSAPTAAPTPSVPQPAVVRPRPSKLALASALALPVAILSGVILGSLVFLIVMMIGLVMGIAALTVIRNSSGRVYGRGLAFAGIAEVVALLLLLAVGMFVHSLRTSEMSLHGGGPPEPTYVEAAPVPVVKVIIDLPHASPEEVDSRIGVVFRHVVFATPQIYSAKAISSAAHFEGYVEGTSGASGAKMFEAFQKQLRTRTKDLPAGATTPEAVLLPLGRTIPAVEVKGVPEIRVMIDRAKAADLGISTKTIMEAVEQYSQRGTVGATTQQSMPDISIPTPRGGTVQLRDIATLVPTTRPSHIIRTLP